MALTADCLPVALAAPGAAGMVHAGLARPGRRDSRGRRARAARRERRRTRGGVRGRAAAPAPAGSLAAAIGPCARGCCYEVGDEVRAALGLEATGGPALIDLPAIARERLLAAGVETVHDSGLCTMCTDPSLFFSHRRDGPRTGRQAGVAWR